MNVFKLQDFIPVYVLRGELLGLVGQSGKDY